jgi:cellulose biosynthesis protein BcsQ
MILLVISIHPGSGQTTVLVNLASGLVRQGKRVLIGELGSSPKLRDWLGVAPDYCRATNYSTTLDNLQAVRGTSSGISLIIPNRIDTREWDHNSRQLMALADNFGFDKIADPIPT